VEQLRADFRQNRAFGDTSMKIGMSSLHGSLDKKIAPATWNFKLVATLVEQLGDVIVWSLI